MTMFSRVLGFARDAIVARILAQGWRRMPFSSRLNYRICCVVSSLKGPSQAFVPILAEYKASRAKMRPACLWPMSLAC